MGNIWAASSDDFKQSDQSEQITSEDTSTITVKIPEFAVYYTMKQIAANEYQAKYWWNYQATYKGEVKTYDGKQYADGEGEAYDSKHSFHFKGTFCKGVLTHGTKYYESAGTTRHGSYDQGGELTGRGFEWNHKTANSNYKGMFYQGFPVEAERYDANCNLLDEGVRIGEKYLLHGLGKSYSVNGDNTNIDYGFYNYGVKFEDRNTDTIQTIIYNEYAASFKCPVLCDKCPKM